MSVVEAEINTELTTEVEELLRQGQALAEADQFDQALTILEQVVALEPNHEEVIKVYRKTLSSYTKGLVKRRKKQQAYVALDRALEILPNNETLLGLYGTIATWSKDFEKATQCYEKALAINSTDVITLNGYAQLLVNRGNYEKASQLFERSLQLDSGHIITLNSYAQLLMKHGNDEKAAQLFEKALKLDDRNVITLSSYAQLLMKQGNNERAAQLFEQALKLDDRNFITLNSYAQLLMKQGNNEKAAQLFEQALKLDDRNVITLSSYAQLLMKQGNDERAAQLFEKALKLDDRNFITLNSYAQLLMKQGNDEKATQLFEQALKLDDRNVITLSSYAQLLMKQGNNERAAQLFEQALKLDDRNFITLNSYAQLLMKQGNNEKAAQLFEQALKLDDRNIPTYTSYAQLLMKQGNDEKATQLFEQALKLDDRDVITLNNYAQLLMKQGNNERAAQLFEKALKLDDRDVITLNNYAHLLIKQGNDERAAQLFEQALKLDDRNVITLSSYAQLLMRQGNDEKAAQLFEQALKLDNRDVITLNNYAQLLMRQGNARRATQLFEQALKLDDRNPFTLSLYTQGLAKQGNYQKVCELLDQVVEADPFTRGTHSYSSFKLAQTLEAEGRYQEALDQLLKIDLSQQRSHDANVIRLNLGRLYYLLSQPEIGKDYFTKAIELAEDPDATRLYAARSLLASNFRSEAITILQDIEETSPRYTTAIKTIALNADAQTSYELFAGEDNSFEDTTMLYRAMYHKMGNEVAILKSIAQRILRKIEGEHPLVQEIVEALDELQGNVTRRRATEKAAIATIPHESYPELIKVVSRTAHNIADEVNNSLATIVSKTRRVLRNLPEDSPVQTSFEKLLTQLELTQNALNDLKSINEGIKIRRHRFPVCKLFEKWQPKNWSNTPRLNRAGVRLNIQNPNSEFDGDEEKIKSILNELVENSLKQNPNHPDFCIWIKSQDLLNPMDVSMPTIPGDRQYLFIQVTDNGKGVPEDKKEWIFQPLHTTSPEEKGSGLGLFIARKTLQKMGGSIREVGDPGRGARFQIYIPYLPS